MNIFVTVFLAVSSFTSLVGFMVSLFDDRVSDDGSVGLGLITFLLFLAFGLSVKSV